MGVTAALLAGLDEGNAAWLARKAALPALGASVTTASGTGQVVAVDVSDERITVRGADGELFELVGPALAPAPPASDAPANSQGRGRRGRGRRERSFSAGDAVAQGRRDREYRSDEP